MRCTNRRARPDDDRIRRSDHTPVLRQITAEQLLHLGTRQMVYLKSGMRDGEQPSWSTALTQSPLSSSMTLQQRSRMAHVHGLGFVTVHQRVGCHVGDLHPDRAAPRDAVLFDCRGDIAPDPADQRRIELAIGRSFALPQADDKHPASHGFFGDVDSGVVSGPLMDARSMHSIEFANGPLRPDPGACSSISGENGRRPAERPRRPCSTMNLAIAAVGLCNRCRTTCRRSTRARNPNTFLVDDALCEGGAADTQDAVSGVPVSPRAPVVPVQQLG